MGFQVYVFPLDLSHPAGHHFGVGSFVENGLVLAETPVCHRSAAAMASRIVCTVFLAGGVIGKHRQRPSMKYGGLRTPVP